MNNATARAVASVAVAAACCGIAFAEPAYGVLCVVGIVAGIYAIWNAV